MWDMWKGSRSVRRDRERGHSCALAVNPAEVDKKNPQPNLSGLDRSGCFALVGESPPPRGRHHTGISTHVSRRHRAAHNISSGSRLVPAASPVALCFWRAIISGIKTNLQTHTRHPTRSLHMANVSHVFPCLGRFLPRGRHIKQHAVFHNFCQMTQCYVIPVLFQLESTVWH